jgi:hypothetical protein
MDHHRFSQSPYVIRLNAPPREPVTLKSSIELSRKAFPHTRASPLPVVIAEVAEYNFLLGQM